MPSYQCRRALDQSRHIVAEPEVSFIRVLNCESRHKVAEPEVSFIRVLNCFFNLRVFIKE